MKQTELEPGWYYIEFNGDRLFREKRAGDRYLYNQRGYKQFHFSEYKILYRIVFEPIAKGDCAELEFLYSFYCKVCGKKIESKSEKYCSATCRRARKKAKQTTDIDNEELVCTIANMSLEISKKAKGEK